MSEPVRAALYLEEVAGAWGGNRAQQQAHRTVSGWRENRKGNTGETAKEKCSCRRSASHRKEES